MRPRLPFSLKAALLASCVFCPFATSASVSDGSLGNVMYVGDSITHGVNSGSYRWALHKIFADNGISYSTAGINTGNYSGGVAAGISYGGRVFNNAHSSQASARAYEIAGRADGANYRCFNGSNISNWLGLSTEKTKGGTYTGQTFTGTAAPDTFFILVGTNDLLSDGNNGTLNDRLSAVTQNLLGDMDTMVEAMKTANSGAEIIVLSIPCWTQHANGNSSATHQAVADYNESLKNWGRDKDGVTVIDVNQGIIDVASSTPFYGVRTMFNNPTADGLHPNAQGDLLMAGNLARGMGYAGRSAGQERKASHELGVNFGQTPSITREELTARGFTASNVTISNNTINFNNAGTSTLTYSWGESQGGSAGYTVDFTLRLGNGSTGGWDTTNNFSLNLGNGTLNINEAYIQWGSAILYSRDMSANTDTIRVAYVAGDNANGLSAGYYIWLGDVLIGEAQTAAGANSSGLTFSYSGTLDAILSNLALDGTLSYAPSSSGITGPEAIYLAHGRASALKPGMIEWTTDTGATAVAPAGANNTYNVRNSTNSNISNITGTGSTKLIHANSGAYGTAENRQDLWVTLGEGVVSNNGWIGGHTSGDLYGNINLRFAEGSIGKSTVFGAVNAGTVHGDIYLEFSSSTGNFDTSFTAGEADRTSVAGAYATAVNGDITMAFNDGVFSHRIFGGVYTGAKTISGSTSLYINGGTFMNEIYAGNKTDGTISQGTSLTITGTNAILGKADGDNWAWTLLCGGNKTSGTINGGTTITLKDIAATTGNGTEHKFDKYAGTIDGKGGGTVNGEKKLVFDHYTASFLGTLQNFDKVQVTGNSDLTLDKALGNTVSSLAVDQGSTLRFNEDQGASLDITNNGTLNIDLPQGTAPEDKATAIRYLAGTESDAVVNTGTDKDVIITLLNETSAEPGKPGNTAYAGSILGSARLVKDGERKLTIDGRITASALDVHQGELVLQNRAESSIISGTLNVERDAALTLNSASLAAADLTGSGSITLAGGALLTISRETLSDLTLNASITGAGTLKLGNCNLVLTTGSNLGENVLLHLDGGGLRLQDGSTIALEGLHQEQENGTLHLGADGHLELASSNGKTYSFKGEITGTGVITHRGEGTQIILSSGNGNVDVSHTRTGGHLVLGDKNLAADGSMAYRNISIGDNTREASDLDATADLSLMNNTTAGTLSIASNGKLYLGGNPNQRAVQLVLTGNNTGVAADLASGASLDLTVSTETVSRSADSGWAAIQAENGSIRISGTEPSINVNIYGLGAAGDWAILPEFTINALYAENGLVTADGTSWTADMVNLTYAGFANLVYDIGKMLSDDGRLFQVRFTKLGDSPLKDYASTDNQKAAVDSLWTVTSAPQNISPAMMEFLNAVGNAQAAGDAGTIQSALSFYAGSGITALHSAQKGALKDQVLHLRNRVAQMGASLQYVNDDLPRFNAWIEGEGGYRKLDDRRDESGYKLNTWGGTFGFDVTCSDSFVWGAAFSASYGDLDAYRANGDLDSYYGNLFFRLQSGRWAHNLILTCGWNDASLNRTAGVAGTGMYSMHGSTSGSSCGAFYEGTYDLYLNENRTSVFQPLVNGSIYKSRMDGFTETGGLGMSVDDMDSTYGTVGLGARLRGELSDNLMGRACLGELRVQVVQNLGDRKTTAALAPVGAPGAGFRVNGAREGATGVQIGAGLTIPVGYTGSVFADVNADFRSRAGSVNGSIGYRLAF